MSRMTKSYLQVQFLTMQKKEKEKKNNVAEYILRIMSKKV